jgi:hypothetical protein
MIPRAYNLLWESYPHIFPQNFRMVKKVLRKSKEMIKVKKKKNEIILASI